MKVREVRIAKEVKKEWWLVTFRMWRCFSRAQYELIQKAMFKFSSFSLEYESHWSVFKQLSQSIRIPFCDKQVWRLCIRRNKQTFGNIAKAFLCSHSGSHIWVGFIYAEGQSFYTDKTFSSKFTQKSVFIQRARIHVNLQDFTPDLEIIYTDISAISVTLCNFGFMRQEWGENLWDTCGGKVGIRPLSHDSQLLKRIKSLAEEKMNNVEQLRRRKN